jgi:hypothetical protein
MERPKFLKSPDPKQLITLNYMDNSIHITHRVQNFILNYIKNYSILCRQYFNSIRDCNSEMPTSCTIFARVIFYAFYRIDPNGESMIQTEYYNAGHHLDLAYNLLYKIDLWISTGDDDIDVVHSFVIFRIDEFNFKIAQSYGDDAHCVGPTIRDINSKVLYDSLDALISNSEDKIEVYKNLCNISDIEEDANYIFSQIEIVSPLGMARGINKKKKIRTKKQKMKKMKKRKIRTKRQMKSF